MRVTTLALVMAFWVLVASCASLPPEQATREALMWEAAQECRRNVPTIRLDRIDQGVLWFRYEHGAAHDMADFKDCYQQRVREKLKSVPPVRLVETGRVSPRAVGLTKTSVPIEVVEGLSLVRVTLNERDHATLLLDTGASFTVLSPALMERLGISVPQSARRVTGTIVGGKTVSFPVVQVGSVKAGDLGVENMEIGVYDALPEVKHVDGVLGANFLSHFRVTIDHHSRQLTLELAQPAASATSTGSAGGSPGLAWHAPRWIPRDEWKFRWESPIGKGTFVWTVTGEELIDNIAYYLVKSGTRTLYYAKHNLGWHMDKVEGAVVERASPPVSYDWPLEVGKSWELTYEWEDLSARQTEQRYRKCTVEGDQTLTVPAGTFLTRHIVCKDQRGRVVSEVWYSPEVKHWVKQKSLRAYGERVRELLSHQVR